ncbi:FRG domain-containing protein [Alistipes onderdonkii]|nr:FRG domain-containing protein [Alistipes onderdonkii]
MELDLNIDSNGNVIVNTLSEYVAYISQLQAANEGSNERFFFRGQSNKNWDVRPCLFRENNLTIESDIISEACARAPFEFGGRSAFERLTKLQHYGLPTRMLDVTLNPLVALYFACAKCEDKENYDKNYKESDTIDVDSDHSFDNEYDVDGAVYYRRAYGHKHNSDDIDLLARIAEMDFSGLYC